MLLISCLAVFGFLTLAQEVAENDTRKFDEAVLLAMREPGDIADPYGPAGIEEMARDLTALGGATLLTGVVLVGFGIALFAGRKRLAWFAIGSVIVGSISMKYLKMGYDRPRPDLVEHAVLVTNKSFPSGHSMMAALVYLTLGIVLARTQKRGSMRVFIIAISILITLLVGLSRLYLGVHWPTDVLAGWMLGATWALIFGFFAQMVDDPR